MLTNLYKTYLRLFVIRINVLGFLVSPLASTKVAAGSTADKPSGGYCEEGKLFMIRLDLFWFLILIGLMNLRDKSGAVWYIYLSVYVM